MLTALLVLPSLIVTLRLLMERTDGWIGKLPLPSNSLTFWMLACGVSWETFSLMATLVTYWERGGAGSSGESVRPAQLLGTISIFPFLFHLLELESWSVLHLAL